MRLPTVVAAAMALGGLIAACPPAIATPSGYTFTQINLPKPSYGYALGINNQGQIVGSYTDSAGNPHGFLDTRGQFTNIDPPGSTFSVPVAINNRGEILGSSDSIGNYIYDHGTYTPVNAPGFVFGLNDRGQIVGENCPASACTGYVDTRGNITNLALPYNAAANAINDSGQIVGEYGSPPDVHGFLYSHGAFTTIDVPGAPFTEPFGINNRGQIVGTYCDATGTVCPGLLDTNGQFTTINVPGSSFTSPQAINDHGQIVGFDSIGGNFGVFLATPINGFATLAADPPAAGVPEPSSLALMTVGLIGAGFIVRRLTVRRR